jgi:hypothetical protein
MSWFAVATMRKRKPLTLVIVQVAKGRNTGKKMVRLLRRLVQTSLMITPLSDSKYVSFSKMTPSLRSLYTWITDF